MKVSYDLSGNILVVTLDNEFCPENFIHVEDNQDLLLNPNKYKVDVVTKTVVKRPYLKLTTSHVDTNNNGIPDTSVSNSSGFEIVVQKYRSDDTLNETASDLITVDINGSAIAEPYSFSLVGGQASFVIRATQPGIKTVIVRSQDPDCCFGMMNIEFI